MSMSAAKGSPFTEKRIRRGIKLDRVNPTDFLKLPLIYACEDCSYFKSEDKSCLLGFPAIHHLKENQLHQYSLNGHMAFCRFLEID